MSKLRQFLETVDEEYLIGLSNKGIVKRSYKDLENTTVEITEEGEEIRGVCGDAQVVLKLPLTNSTCSCPSTSICKHVIMTLLTAQKADGEAQKAGGEVQNAMAQEATSSQGDAPVQEINTAAGEEAPKETASNETTSKETESRKESPKEELGEKIGLQKSAIAKYENGRVENIKRSTGAYITAYTYKLYFRRRFKRS